MHPIRRGPCCNDDETGPRTPRGGPRASFFIADVEQEQDVQNKMCRTRRAEQDEKLGLFEGRTPREIW